jgi:hypothetical protein
MSLPQVYQERRHALNEENISKWTKVQVKKDVEK